MHMQLVFLRETRSFFAHFYYYYIFDISLKKTLLAFLRKRQRVTLVFFFCFPRSIQHLMYLISFFSLPMRTLALHVMRHLTRALRVRLGLGAGQKIERNDQIFVCYIKAGVGTTEELGMLMLGS